MVQVRRARHNHVRRVFGFAVWSLLVQVIVATSSSNDSSTCDENSTLSTRDNGNWFKPPKLVIKQEQGFSLENAPYTSMGLAGKMLFKQGLLKLVWAKVGRTRSLVQSGKRPEIGFVRA